MRGGRSPVEHLDVMRTLLPLCMTSTALKLKYWICNAQRTLSDISPRIHFNRQFHSFHKLEGGSTYMYHIHPPPTEMNKALISLLDWNNGFILSGKHIKEVGTSLQSFYVLYI